MGQRIGYQRVSTVDQNTDRQLDGVELDKVFTDKASGKDANRPELHVRIEYVRDGDTLVVHSMDRLARNLEDLRRIVRELTGQGVRVEFVKENLTFAGDDSPMNTLLLSMLGAVAEFERSMILERQREGIALAKAAGKYKGRKASLRRRRPVSYANAWPRASPLRHSPRNTGESSDRLQLQDLRASERALRLPFVPATNCGSVAFAWIRCGTFQRHG